MECVARYDFTAGRPDELSFREKDVLKVSTVGLPVCTVFSLLDDPVNISVVLARPILVVGS